MTKEEVKTRLLTCLGINPEDFDEESEISDFFTSEELEKEAKPKIEHEFDICIDSLDPDEKLTVILNGLCEYFGITE